MKHGSKIKFHGEADQKPGHLPGDVMFVVQQKEHAVFKRKAHHLIMEKEISLSEALTGVEMVVKHLDGRQLVVRSEPGDVISPGTFKRVANEGMPMHGNPFVKGNLIVAFDVKFPVPGSLRQPALKALAEALPSKPDSGADKLGDEAEEYGMEVFTPEMLKADLEQNRAAYDSDEDDDEDGSGKRVQCQQS